MSSVSKKENDLYKSLDKLYNKDKGKIISWLDELKVYKSKDGKIPGLLNNSKIQILTATEDGTYNLILQWIKKNADKFADYDFTGVPDSAFISTAALLDDTEAEAGAASGPARSSNVVKTFKTVQDVERWFKDPEIHPIKGTPMSAMSNEYYNIYEKAYKIRKHNGIVTTLNNDYTETQSIFPKNHLLFGDIDLVYYTCVKNYYPHLYKRIYQGKENMLAICELLTEKLEDTANTDTVLETEMELLRNRFNSQSISDNTPIWHIPSNMKLIKDLINNVRVDLVDAFLDTDYMYRYEYPERMKSIKEAINNIEGYWFINFLETNKMANGETPIKYFINVLKKPNPPYWISQVLKLYNDYMLVIKDIDECFNPASGIVENVEDKKLTLIDDPIDKYFDFYENKLAEIRKPVYSQLIDLTTFKPKENLKYLNDAEYAVFKKEKDKYDILWNNYKEAQELYERTGRGNSPNPPIKPTITLPWGKVHTIAKEIDPIHIKDEVIVKFREEYAKSQSVIDEYNSIKNMSYKELKKHVEHSSPSSAEMRLIEGNKLLSMTREEFVDNILYDKKKYRTECIYAPKLYNYLIKCINSKEPFINPVTKAKYTPENIEELMKVMRIINPNMEVPIFIKHRNDTKLKINYITHEVNLRVLGADASFAGIPYLRFNEMYLSRMIAGVEKKVHVICYIPDDIEATGTFATGSADLNSYTMLVNIYKLFNEGRLLYNYLPPYNIPRPGITNEYIYLKPRIHFNKIRTIDNWVRKSNYDPKLLTKEEFVNRFKHYAQEINNYTF